MRRACLRRADCPPESSCCGRLTLLPRPHTPRASCLAMMRVAMPVPVPVPVVNVFVPVDVVAVLVMMSRGR